MAKKPEELKPEYGVIAGCALIVLLAMGMISAANRDGGVGPALSAGGYFFAVMTAATFWDRFVCGRKV